MRRFLLPVLAALVSAAAVASISIAGSGTSTSGSDTAATPRRSGPPPTLGEVFKKMQARHNRFLDRVAKRLDISGDRLREAMDKVMRDHLDAEVKANRLTGAQRDAMLACKAAPLTCDRSNLPAPRFHHVRRAFGPARGRHVRPRHHPKPLGPRGDFFEALAKELGKDEDDVRQAFFAEHRRSGRDHVGPAPHPAMFPPGGAIMIG